MSASRISIFGWHLHNVQEIPSQVALFNCDAMAAATRVESNSPFCISINGTDYLAYKRHASAVVSGLGLGDMLILLKDTGRVANDLALMGIRAISMNSCNAQNDLAALPDLVSMKCKLRFEFLLDTEIYSLDRISSNHRRNIKKSKKIQAHIVLPQGLSAMRKHIDMVNGNLSKKGLGGLTNSPEYFQSLMDQGAGILVQVNQGGQLLASTFFLKNEDYAYYHSSGASEYGRQSGAAHFLVDGMINEMRERGIRYLNFGGCTSEQSGLYRFKLGFRPETHILFSAHHQLRSGFRGELQSLLAARAKDILNIAKVPVFVKSSLDSGNGDDIDYACRTMPLDAVIEAVSKNPELGESLTNCIRLGSPCYAMETRKGEIIATGFIQRKKAQTAVDPTPRRESSNFAEVSHIYVIKSMRNKGVGRALLGFLERQLSEMGYDQAVARVDACNIAAKTLLMASGFRLIGEEKALSTTLFGGRRFVLGKINP